MIDKVTDKSLKIPMLIDDYLRFIYRLIMIPFRYKNYKCGGYKTIYQIFNFEYDGLKQDILFTKTLY